MSEEGIERPEDRSHEPRSKMTDEDYSAMQHQMLLFANLVAELDTAGFLNRISHAHAITPILDPTLYHRGMDNLGQIERIASALHDFRTRTAEPLKKLRGWAEAQH